MDSKKDSTEESFGSKAEVTTLQVSGAVVMSTSLMKT